MDATRFGKTTIFDFKQHRQPEEYGALVAGSPG
jgi:hypothetical protein